MQKLFKGMETGDPEAEKKLQEVLYGGKNTIKRASAVDTSLYGTQAGVEAKKKYEQDQQKKKRKKKKKQVNNAKEQDSMEQVAGESDVAVSEEKSVAIGKESVLKIAAVGAVAAVAAFFLGGSRSR